MELVSCLSLPVYLLPISFHLTLLRLPFYLSLCQNASSLLSSSPLSVSLLMAFFSPFLNLILTSLLPCQFAVPLFSSSVALSFTPPPSHYFQLLLTIFLSLCHSSSFPFLDHLFLPPFLQISALFLPYIRAIFPSSSTSSTSCSLLPLSSSSALILLTLTFSTVLLLPCCRKRKGRSRIHSRGSGQPGARLPAEWRPGPRGSQTKLRAKVPDAMWAEHHDDPWTDPPPVDHHGPVVSWNKLMETSCHMTWARCTAAPSHLSGISNQPQFAVCFGGNFLWGGGTAPLEGNKGLKAQ